MSYGIRLWGFYKSVKLEQCLCPPKECSEGCLGRMKRADSCRAISGWERLNSTISLFLSQYLFIYFYPNKYMYLSKSCPFYEISTPTRYKNTTTSNSSKFQCECFVVSVS